MRNYQLRLIAREFFLLAERFEQWSRSSRIQHLSVHLAANHVRAGRLLEQAAKAGGFEGESYWRNGEPAHFNFSQRTSPPDDEHWCLLWIFAIGPWLVKRFPDRFRKNAHAWDWKYVATDESGHPVDKNRRPLRGRWYKNGKAMPRGFKPPSGGNRAGYSWRLEGELAWSTDFYDEADALEHQRVRAEVYADACRVLADFITSRIEGGGQASLKPIPSAPCPVVRVADDNGSVEVDGEAFRLRSDRDGRFIRALLNNRGRTVKACVLEQQAGARPDRVFARLPAPVRAIISKPGRGSVGYLMHPVAASGPGRSTAGA